LAGTEQLNLLHCWHWRNSLQISAFLAGQNQRFLSEVHDDPQQQWDMTIKTLGTELSNSWLSWLMIFRFRYNSGGWKPTKIIETIK
jgi:hypothetical protein